MRLSESSKDNLPAFQEQTSQRSISRNISHSIRSIGIKTGSVDSRCKKFPYEVFSIKLRINPENMFSQKKKFCARKDNIIKLTPISVINKPKIISHTNSQQNAYYKQKLPKIPSLSNISTQRRNLKLLLSKNTPSIGIPMHEVPLLFNGGLDLRYTNTFRNSQISIPSGISTLKTNIFSLKRNIEAPKKSINDSNKEKEIDVTFGKE